MTRNKNAMNGTKKKSAYNVYDSETMRNKM